jgi:hypothetical protein
VSECDCAVPFSDRLAQRSTRVLYADTGVRTAHRVDLVMHVIFMKQNHDDNQSLTCIACLAMRVQGVALV